MNKVTYLSDLKVDLDNADTLEIIKSEINLADYVSIKEFRRNYPDEKILDEMGNDDIANYLDDESYFVFKHRYNVINELTDKEVLAEVEARRLESKVKPPQRENFKPDELKRLLCDIIGCGYHMHTNDELLIELKKML